MRLSKVLASARAPPEGIARQAPFSDTRALAMPLETIVDAVERAARCDPTRGFRFVSEEGVPGFGSPRASEASFSFTAIERASARYGGALQALGLRKGDRVALILPDNEDFVLAFLGALRAGLVPVPIYPPVGLGQLQSYLDNTRHIVGRSGARALVTSSAIKRLLGTVKAASPDLAQIVAVEAIRESMEALRGVSIGGSDTAFLQFTSGSTARPKGVVLSHANLMANIRAIMDEALHVTEEDVGVSWLPLYHDMGLIGFLLAPLARALPVVLLPPLLFTKRPVTWLQALSRHRGTISYAPNFAYALATRRVRDHEIDGLDLSSWRVAGCGAEPIRPETLEAFAQKAAPAGFHAAALLPSYGMAESTLAVACARAGDGMRTRLFDGDALFERGVAATVPDGDARGVRLVSCGRPFAGHDLAIFDPERAADGPLGDGRVGEVRTRGPSVTRGYFGDDRETEAAFEGGYLCTGDLGFLLDGELYLCGRRKELIIVSGRNFYPQDIEWAASQVPGVRRGGVVAFGARDPSGRERDRERVVVVFERQSPATPRSKDADDSEREALSRSVRGAVQESLGLTLDDAVAVDVGVLPKTSSGKLQRTWARALYEADTLSGRASRSERQRLLDLAHAAKSQLSYLKLAVLGGRRAP